MNEDIKGMDDAQVLRAYRAAWEDLRIHFSFDQLELVKRLARVHTDRELAAKVREPERYVGRQDPEEWYIGVMEDFENIAAWHMPGGVLYKKPGVSTKELR